MITAIAVDYFRTLTGEARCEPTGSLVRTILAEFGIDTSNEFADTFDTSKPRYYANPVSETIPDLLTATARHHGVDLPDIEQLIGRIWTLCGDHPIDPKAADAVRALHAEGLTVVLASNTVRPSSFRAATLKAAGLDMMRLVCSSEVGVGKPHSRFYERVSEVADADPDQILFAGDDLARDVVAPIEHGMQAAWIHRNAAAGSGPTVMVDGTLALAHLAQLPAALHMNRQVS